MARGRQAIVLVLDDDPSVGKFVQGALDEQSYRTIWRSSVVEAVATLEDDLPDLALVDIELGATESGWDLMRALRERPETRTIPIVMMTGSSDTMNRERSLRMGADRYLI